MGSSTAAKRCCSADASAERDCRSADAWLVAVRAAVAVAVFKDHAADRPLLLQGEMKAGDATARREGDGLFGAGAGDIAGRRGQPHQVAASGNAREHIKAAFVAGGGLPDGASGEEAERHAAHTLFAAVQRAVAVAVLEDDPGD